MNAPPKILVIMPAYNEAGNISDAVKEVQSFFPSVDILVVNDASSDATEQKAAATGAWVVSLPFNLGIGGAVQTGFQFAREYGYAVAVQMDGDGQHDARFLKDLLRPVLEERADIAIGSRFLPPYLGYQSSFVRRLGIHFFSWLIGSLTGRRVTDPTSGFRACNRRMIELFAEHYPQDYPEPEAIVTASRCGAGITEVPVQMREREMGHSSIRYLKTLYYMVKVSSAMLLDMVKKKRGDNGH